MTSKSLSKLERSKVLFITIGYMIIIFCENVFKLLDKALGTVFLFFIFYILLLIIDMTF